MDKRERSAPWHTTPCVGELLGGAAREVWAMSETEGLCLMTIYAHPRDYPEGFVLRCWRVGGGRVAPEPMPGAHLCGSLDEARELAVNMGGAGPIPRMPGDDPCIVETWL